MPSYATAVVEGNKLAMTRRVARQPVMVDGTILRCEGMVNEFIRLGSRGIRASFYVVKGISYGILGTDVLSSLAVQIDVANKKLCMDGDEVSSFEKVDTIQQLCSAGKIWASICTGPHDDSSRTRNDYMGSSSFRHTNGMDRYY